jgi:MinD superfamily P-loop ATPase
MVIAVASGKGGTGKTTVSVNMARAFGAPVQLLDCDVEEPNAHLFLRSSIVESREVTIPVPCIDEFLCDGCGECSRFCEYNAIVALNSRAIVFPDLCHGCGGCAMVCPRNAIVETERRIGSIDKLRSEHIVLIQGCLDVGVPTAPPLIRAVKARLSADTPAILDAPPGTSCPVVTTLRSVDFAVLVTEPTPFGLHDLKLAIQMVRELEIPHGVVVNRVGIGDERIHLFCEAENIPILLEIPDDRRIAEAYSVGKLTIEALPEYREKFRKLVEDVMGEVSQAEPGDVVLGHQEAKVEEGHV